MLPAVTANAIATFPSVELARLEAQTATTSDALGANARQAMIDIFRKKDVTAVDRNFGRSFTQHDPTLVDGYAGMKSFAAEIASSPASDITIYLRRC
jgi:NAD/NADP transhydrogenase alpha subunit